MNGCVFGFSHVGQERSHICNGYVSTMDRLAKPGLYFDSADEQSEAPALNTTLGAVGVKVYFLWGRVGPGKARYLITVRRGMFSAAWPVVLYCQGGSLAEVRRDVRSCRTAASDRPNTAKHQLE